MRSNTKQALLVTVVGVTLFVALLRLSDVLAFAAQLVDLVLPILAGGILALFLSVPMAGLEKRLGRLFAKARKQPSGKALHLLSFLLTLLGVVLVLVLALTLLIPELVQSFHSLYLQIEANIPRWTAYLHAQDHDMGWLMSRLEGIDWEQLLHKVTSGLDTVLVNAAGAVSATVNLVVTASFALIISVYLSLGAQSLGHQARTLVRAYLKPGHAAWVLKFCRLFRQSFANFLTGQCSEAVILGMLMSLAFSLFRIPYGSLVGMLTAICAIIPYVGALLSCVISVFLVLLVDPLLAVRALLVYLAVQFIENQFIYPRVVGKSVGLSPLYTLVAAMIGGKLFGILGILFFIPLTAVVLELVKEDASDDAPLGDALVRLKAAVGAGFQVALLDGPLGGLGQLRVGYVRKGGQSGRGRAACGVPEEHCQLGAGMGHGHPCRQELVKDELRAHLIGHDARHVHDCDAHQKGAEAVSAVWAALAALGGAPMAIEGHVPVEVAHMVRARAHVVGAILQAGAVFEEPALKEAGFLLAADDRTGDLHRRLRFVPRADDPVGRIVCGGLLRPGDLRLLALVYFAFHQSEAVQRSELVDGFFRAGFLSGKQVLYGSVALGVANLRIAGVLVLHKVSVMDFIEHLLHIAECGSLFILVGCRTDAMIAVPVDVTFSSFRVNVLAVGKVETAVIVLGVIGAVGPGSSVVSC